MKTKLCRLLGMVALLLLGTAAQATITCNVSSNGFFTAYDPARTTTTTAQTSVQVSCSRASGDPTSVAYTIKADNGLNNNGINNRAFLSPSYIKYDVYQDSGCATQWKGNTTFSGTINFNVAPTASHNFWGCVIALQTGLGAGVYVDTITTTLTYGASPASTATGQFTANISTPWTCSLSLPAGTTVAFGTYVAYGAAVNASAPFGVNCTNYLPYTLSISPAGGSIAGVAYTLAPSVSSNTGSGVQQNMTIDGTMAAGQAGTCAAGTCSGTNAHTLIVTY